MERRRRVYWAGVAALAVALVAACAGAGLPTPAASAQSGARPNIVLVLTDDQRFDTLATMPTVEQALVARGVSFTNSFVVNSLCCPSRASLLSGQYSHSTGVYKNAPPHGGFPSFHDARTIATVLERAGYTTGLFGKYLNLYGTSARDARYVPPGWDRWAAFLGKTSFYDYRLVDRRRIEQHGQEPSDYSTDVLARKAVSFLAHARKPFFLEFTPFAPHEPATPPPRYAKAFERVPWTKPSSFDELNLSDKPAYMRNLAPLTQKQLEQVGRFRRHQLVRVVLLELLVGERRSTRAGIDDRQEAVCIHLIPPAR